MNASRTSCFSIELARIRISNALIPTPESSDLSLATDRVGKSWFSVPCHRSELIGSGITPAQHCFKLRSAAPIQQRWCSLRNLNPPLELCKVQLRSTKDQPQIPRNLFVIILSVFTSNALSHHTTPRPRTRTPLQGGPITAPR